MRDSYGDESRDWRYLATPGRAYTLTQSSAPFMRQGSASSESCVRLASRAKHDAIVSDFFAQSRSRYSPNKKINYKH
jgi:hypothetical protein